MTQEQIKQYFPNIRTGVWISPSKKKLPFEFVGDLEFEQNKKIATQEVPLSSYWSVQDLGVGMMTFSLQMAFFGQDADKKSKIMIEALAEPGSGMLLHPAGENILCTATGWKLQPAALQKIRLAKLSVSFVKTHKQAFPSTARDFEGDIKDVQRRLLSPTPSLLNRITSYPLEKLQWFKKRVQNVVDLSITPFRQISGVSAKYSNALFMASLEFQNLLDIDAPILETLASVGGMCSLIREFDINVSQKKKSYTDAIARILGYNPFSETTQKQKALEIENLDEAEKFVLKDLAISRFFAFENTKFKAPELVEFMNENIDLYMGIIASPVIEEDEALQLLESLQLSVGAMTRILEHLPKCRVHILNEDSTPINLAWELYHDSERCSDIIDDNFLTASEHFFLPKGKQIRYFA